MRDVRAKKYAHSEWITGANPKHARYCARSTHKIPKLVSSESIVKQ
jgi:hypothetical protein